jgi:hypothetical protein
MVFKNKEGKMSKTKWGALLIGAGAILGTIGAFVNGSLDLLPTIQALAAEVGAIVLAFGIRDVPILNSILSKK